MRFLRRALTGLFLMAVTIGLLATAGGLFMGALQDRAAREDRPREARERVFAANVLPIAPQTITPVMTSFGGIESRRTLEVRASAGGRVLEIGNGVQEGGRVDQGQLLFRLDPVDAQRGLDVARADLQDAEAELTEAIAAEGLAQEDIASARAQADLRVRALERQQDLERRGVGTSANVEVAELARAAAQQAVLSRRQAAAQAQAREAQARTRLDRERIDLGAAQRALDDTVIAAAFTGVLSDISVVPGGLVSANERLADLIDPTALEVAFRLSTPQYARLVDEGGRLTPAPLRVVLEVDGFILDSPGTLSRAAAIVGDGQTGREVFARLDKPQGFRPGDFAEVLIEEPPLSQVVLLPASAVDAQGRVLVLEAEDRLTEASVTVLRRQGDDVLVRAEGLTGAEVVAERTPLLGPGIKVRPLRPDAPEAAAPDLVDLTDERRAALVAFVEGNARMPDDAKARVLAQLREPRVPAGVVERIEGRM